MGFRGWSFVVVVILCVVYVAYKRLFHLIKTYFYNVKSKDLRFLLIKIPRKESDLDHKNDTIQSMKQNIEIMNQVYKNFYSIYSGKYLDKHFAQNYLSLEMIVEKESIKFVL
ncbi:MAG: hypothetical protein ACOZBL_03640 [Patescibacteria group bacterium]